MYNCTIRADQEVAVGEHSGCVSLKSIDLLTYFCPATNFMPLDWFVTARSQFFLDGDEFYVVELSKVCQLLEWK